MEEFLIYWSIFWSFVPTILKWVGYFIFAVCGVAAFSPTDQDEISKTRLIHHLVQSILGLLMAWHFGSM